MFVISGLETENFPMLTHNSDLMFFWDTPIIISKSHNQKIYHHTIDGHNCLMTKPNKKKLKTFFIKHKLKTLTPTLSTIKILKNLCWLKYAVLLLFNFDFSKKTLRFFHEYVQFPNPENIDLKDY